MNGANPFLGEFWVGLLVNCDKESHMHKRPNIIKVPDTGYQWAEVLETRACYSECRKWKRYVKRQSRRWIRRQSVSSDIGA